MGRMVRKQINIEDELDVRLQQLAEEKGISQSEVVRQALERYLHETQVQTREEALKALKEHWAEGERRGISSGGKKWTREEMHERPGDARRHKRSHLR